MPFRDETQFQAGSLSASRSFWADVILRDAPVAERTFILDILDHGVRVDDYLAEPDGAGGWKPSTGPPASSYPNRVPPEFEAFVTQTLASAEAAGTLRRFVPVPGGPERPHLVLALSIEPTKPRLITDARPLNAFTREQPFSLDNVGHIPSLIGVGELMVSLDHTNAYSHVNLHCSSERMFGIRWKNILYAWCCLSFGYMLSPYIYQRLSAAIAAFVRSQGFPSVPWLDDFIAAGGGPRAEGTPLRPLADRIRDARRASFVLTGVTIMAGYFVAQRKSVLIPTFSLRYLGFILDSAEGTFAVPEDKKQKFLALVRSALRGTASRRVRLSRPGKAARESSVTQLRGPGGTPTGPLYATRPVGGAETRASGPGL